MIGHSQVYKSANPSFTHLTYWGCYLWPGCTPVVPTAAEVCLPSAPVPQSTLSCFLFFQMVKFLGLLFTIDGMRVGLA